MALRQVLEPASVGVQRQKMIIEVLSLLTPFDLVAVRKVRIGSPGDGSYVLVDRLRSSQPVMSFGVGPSVNFEMGMAERGHDVLMFDHTIDKIPAHHDRFAWFREGIAGVSAPERRLYTLAEHMNKLGEPHERPVLKLDIEGDEWDVLDRLPPSLLTRFDQIVLELHGLERLEQPGFNTIARRVLGKLAAHFTLCHVHGNNFCTVRVLAGSFPVPESLELTYIRQDLAGRRPSRTTYPTDIDAPNYPQFPELLLWYFPFLPHDGTIRV
jgi:hypothetical protein